MLNMIFIRGESREKLNNKVSFQLLYVIDTTSQTYVEECINWQEKPTLIVSKIFYYTTDQSVDTRPTGL